MKKFLAYDPEDGLEFFDTEEEARNAAESILEMHRDASVDGWHEQVREVCWAEVKQAATLVKSENAPEGSEFDEICDYELRSVLSD